MLLSFCVSPKEFGVLESKVLLEDQASVRFLSRWGWKCLSVCLFVCMCVISYHHKGVSNPQYFPVFRARRNLDSLTVNCNHHGGSFTDSTSGCTNIGKNKIYTLP